MTVDLHVVVVVAVGSVQRGGGHVDLRSRRAHLRSSVFP